MQLVCPSEYHLASYVAALQQGWSADNVRGAAAAREDLDKIDADPAAFLRSLADRGLTAADAQLVANVAT